MSTEEGQEPVPEKAPVESEVATEQHQIEGQIIEGQIVDGRLVTSEGQIDGQIEEIVTPNDLGNGHHMINIPEGSQIVIVSQDSSELTSLQDMGNHPIVIYNEDGSSVICNKVTYSDNGVVVFSTDQDIQIAEDGEHEFSSIPAITDQLPEMLLSSDSQPGQKDGDSTSNVDIQYGESEITIRLKDDQRGDKQGGLRRKASRTKRAHPEEMIVSEEYDPRRGPIKRNRRSQEKMQRVGDSPKKKFMRLPKRYRTYNKYSELTQSHERVSETVPGSENQIMDNQVIAHVIEEDIEENDLQEGDEMHIVLDNPAEARSTVGRYNQYNEVLVNRGDRPRVSTKKHVSCSDQSTPHQGNPLPPPRSYTEEEHLTRQRGRFDQDVENELAIKYHGDAQLQNVTRSKFWKEIEEWVPEPKTKRMRLTQDEMTQQPTEGFLPLDPYFMVCDPLPCSHPECRLYPSLLYLREIYPRGHGIRQMFHLPEGIESRVAEDNTISACPSKGFGAGVIIGCVVGRTVTLQDAASHKQPDSLWPVYVDSNIHHYVDTSHRHHSNWTRLVRHSSLKEIVNLVVLQSFGTQYLLTVRRIDAGDELVVWTNRNLCMDTSAMDFQQLSCPGIYWRQRTLRKIHYHVCYECGSMFKSPRGIEDHVRHVHNSIPHKPNIVTAPPEKDNKEINCPNWDGTKRDQCGTCGFIHRRSFLPRITKGNMRTFKCMTCFKKFGSSASHKKHMTNNKHRISTKVHQICDYLREAVERKHLPLSDPDVMAAARPRIPRNSEYPIPPAKPFASANDIIIVEGKRYDTQVPLTDPFFKEMFQTRVNTYPYIHRLQASSTLPEEDNCTMLEIQTESKKPIYASRRGRPHKAVKKMLEEAINPQGVASPSKSNMHVMRDRNSFTHGARRSGYRDEMAGVRIKEEPRRSEPMDTKFSTGYDRGNYPAPRSDVWDRPPSPVMDEQLNVSQRQRITALPVDSDGAYDFQAPEKPVPETRPVKPRFENKFGEVFEPYIEETPETTSAGGDDGDDADKVIIPDIKKEVSPVAAKVTKPSPIKTHTPPVSLKKEFAGKSLKASLLDAFNDAVFSFPKRKPVPKTPTPKTTTSESQSTGS